MQTWLGRDDAAQARQSGGAVRVALASWPTESSYMLTASLLGALLPEVVAGKVVLIADVSSSIGEYARRGAYLALGARREESLREVGNAALALGSPGVLVVPADVSSPDDCRKFVDDTMHPSSARAVVHAGHVLPGEEVRVRAAGRCTHAQGLD
ncbi:hypothetical protein E2562_015033 [Oryza meyeriana var. granulata]|uniref:Uncharacterized protein n=1 Tax=Oryza meyeriana var. granulata TaxID=110450 RepID=A0A6G1EJP7_9ORYZ|nr:hypothetical protein E2562_015033 [Oryza meyeriana var. granulata]